METRKREQARRLRKSPTRAEAIFWRMVRDREYAGLKFRRQAPIGPYIVDFACLKHRLIVELDGSVHDAPFRDPEQDLRRDNWLVGEGYQVLRFRNHEVENTPNAVLARILASVGGG